jgi:hypothetical protein
MRDLPMVKDGHVLVPLDSARLVSGYLRQLVEIRQTVVGSKTDPESVDIEFAAYCFETAGLERG